jgi:O-antigen ligase
MARPSPLAGLSGALAWILAAAFLVPFVLPQIPAYRTTLVAGAVLLFAGALVSPRAAFVAAVLATVAAGASALAFGAPEPAWAAPVVLAGYFAGSSLKRIYEMDVPERGAPLLAAWRGVAAASLASAATTIVGLRTGYLLLRDVPTPRAANVLGQDAAQTYPAIVAALASLFVAVGFHRAAADVGRDAAGRRAIEASLVAAALLAGGAALFQKTGLLPDWRAARWEQWGRSQSLFTDPSAAGVAAALLLAPLLARAMSGGAAARIVAAVGVPLLILVVTDAGSRAGLIGALTSAAIFLLWGAMRLAAGARKGRRWRIATALGALTIVGALAFAAALSWPNRGAVRSALLARIETTLGRTPTPEEGTPERFLLYEAAWTMFRERPLAGFGVGGFASAFPNVAAELGTPVTWSDHPPSLYLGVLAESGLAGGLLFALLMLAILRAAGRALSLADPSPESALPVAGAAAALIGLLVVFLFGSHLLYPEIAAFVGILTARLPLRPDGRTARLLAGLVPVVVAGALVVLAGGALHAGFVSRTPEDAFRYAETAGLFGVEREPSGRPFRWTARAAAWRVPGMPGGRQTLALPVRNTRPDLRAVSLAVFWNDRPLGRVALAASSWKRLEVPVEGAGILRLEVSETFRPSRAEDSRRLGIEVGPLAP